MPRPSSQLPSPLSLRSGDTSSALVSVLLVLMVMTVAVTAFLTNMRIERIASRAYLNTVKSQLVARSGLADAMHRLERMEAKCLITSYVTNDITGSGNLIAPYLVALEMKSFPTDFTGLGPEDFFSKTNHLFSAITVGDAEHFYDVQSSLYDSQEAVFDFENYENTTNWVDINAAGRWGSKGWIGLTDEDNERKTIPVPWIYLRNDNDQVIGRYAYWIDDESAKVDLSVVGRATNAITGQRLTTSHAREDGATVSDISLHALFGSQATTIVEKRSAVPEKYLFLSLASLRQIVPEISKTLYDELRSSVTLYSKADERGVIGLEKFISGSTTNEFRGYRRLDINRFVNSATNYTTAPGRTDIAANVWRMAEWITNGIPSFGLRYYSGITASASAAGVAGPLANDAFRYTVKVAANIYDYIDADHQPTVLDANGNWVNPDPANYVAPVSPPAVFGQEVVPNIQDYVGFWVRNAYTSITPYHTWETWNIHNKNIELNATYLGSNPRIIMTQRPEVQSYSSSVTVSQNNPGTINSNTDVWSVSLELGSAPAALIPSGNYTLLTTLPSTASQDSWAVNKYGSTAQPNKVRVPNMLADSVIPWPTGGAGPGFRFVGSSANDGTDSPNILQAAFINDHGFLFIAPRLNQYTGGLTYRTTHSEDQVFLATTPFGNDRPNSGNNTARGYPLDSGDPRSITEYFPEYDAMAGTYSCTSTRRNQCHRSLTPDGELSLGEESRNAATSFTRAIDSINSTCPRDEWVPEPGVQRDIRHTTNCISVIRDGAMRSIGELGHIYDPAVSGNGYQDGGKRVINRGGFRTLPIGSRVGTACELLTTPIGPNPLNQVSPDNNASRLLDLFYADTATNGFRGKININSALRDPKNKALYALFDQITTQTNVTTSVTNQSGQIVFPSALDPTLGGTAGSTLHATNIVNAMVAFQDQSSTDSVATGGVFTRLGMLSDLDIFNSGTTLYTTGVDMAPNEQNNNRLDRGREEAFRNVANLICLKGSAFTVYVVAETGVIRNEKFVKQGTSRLQALVETSRQYRQEDPLQDRSTLAALVANNTPTNTTATILNMEFK